MGRVVHFEIHAENPERASKFYQQVFGWEFHKWEGPMEYWLIKTGPAGSLGIDGGLIKRPAATPAAGCGLNAFACTIDVANLDAAMEKALEQGAQVALPKMPVPGIGWLAYILDPEGNTVGLMQNDPNAA